MLIMQVTGLTTATIFTIYSKEGMVRRKRRGEEVRMVEEGEVCQPSVGLASFGMVAKYQEQT